MEDIIVVRNLKKVFRVHQKEKEGVLYAIKSLFKRKFQIVPAINGIDLTVQKGEIRGLIGPNGAGKSTTIKILSGILFPSEGDVKVMDYIPWRQREEYVKQIGVVFGQKTQLIWELPAIDTFSINQEMYQIPIKKYKENIEYFKELLNIAEIIQRPVRQLSLGEKMKCELVCALLHEPPLVFLDEPTIGLDVISKDIIRNFVKRVNKEKQTTFIITTHDLDDIENLCNNITIINHGTLVYNDSLDNLKSSFGQKKVFTFQFSEKINPDVLKDYNVIHFEPLSAKIEIDVSGTEIQKEISRMFRTLPVKDLEMHNIDVETLIKDYFIS
jgi:ABC-2 type transport system ATP-binding protein